MLLEVVIFDRIHPTSGKGRLESQTVDLVVAIPPEAG